MHFDGIQGMYIAGKKPPAKRTNKVVARVKRVILPKRTYGQKDIMRAEWKQLDSELSFQEFIRERSNTISSPSSEVLKRFK